MQIGDYELKDELRYDKHNNWIRIEGDVATFGITDVGVKLAKDIAFVELPKKGAHVEQGKACGQIESAKWAGEIIAPLSGEITEANDALAGDPSRMNSDPYGQWIAKIRFEGGADSLMDVPAAVEWVKKEVLKE